MSFVLNKKKKFDKNKTIFLVVLLILPVSNWLIFWLGVNIQTILMAFQTSEGVWGFGSFKDVWMSATNPINPLINLKLGLKNTLIYFFSGLFITFPISLVMSFFLYKKVFMYKGFRVIFYLPSIISGVILVTVFSEIVKPGGPLGSVLKALNLPAKDYLHTPGSATIVIVIYGIWTGFCGNILLFNGAMSRIPADVMEAAKLDGVGPFREIVSFVLPLIWPTISSMLILNFTGILGASGPILLFAPNGENETTTISFWLFYQVYGGGGVGSAAGRNLYVVSAGGIALTAITLPIILITRWLVEKVPNYEY